MSGIKMAGAGGRAGGAHSRDCDRCCSSISSFTASLSCSTREVGFEVAFGVRIAVAALVTVSFLSLHLFDRVMAVLSEWMEKYREQKGPGLP